MTAPSAHSATRQGIVALVALAVLGLHAGCGGAEPAASSRDATPPRRTSTPVEANARRVTVEAAKSNPMDSDRAFAYLVQLCNLGPRASGTAGMARQQAMLTKFFEDRGGLVRRQEFLARHPLTGEPVRCANLIVEWNPESSERVLLCAHYDTRPLPDRDPNPRRRRDGVFVGANDGASGVAVLMELANHLPQAGLGVGVDFVLFDAEELVYDGGYRGEQGEYFLGSTYFAKDYANNRPSHSYRWGVLLDMVGDAQLELLQERYSMSWADTRPLVLDLWKTAARLGVEEFVPRTKKGREGFIRDDHIPLRNIARIPTCNIIDADYPDAPFGAPGSFWHTEQDVPRNCSGESLAKVGWVVFEWLKSLESNP